jgi:hypothetical protein
MFSSSYPGADGGPRIVDLADGRVLFLAAGRAFYLQDRGHGERLERRLALGQHLSTAAVGVALGVAVWLKRWEVGLIAVPVFLLAALAERLVVVGCQEATDPAARAEVSARSSAVEDALSRHLLWGAIPLLLMAGSAVMKPRKNPMQMLEVALAGVVFVTLAARFWRDRRVRREEDLVGKPRSFMDNTPTVPR